MAVEHFQRQLTISHHVDLINRRLKEKNYALMAVVMHYQKLFICWEILNAAMNEWIYKHTVEDMRDPTVRQFLAI